MASTLFPVNAVAGAPAYSGRSLRQTLGVLAPGATAARPLGGLSFVRRGTGSPITVTTTTVTVGPHAGQIDAETAAQAGPYWYAFDSNQSQTINAAQSNPRIDIAYVQISDPAESDGTSTPGPAFLYTAGTPAATPAQPATPARSMLLGVINVPATGGGSPTVSWVAPQGPGNDFYAGTLTASSFGGTAPSTPVTMTNPLTIPAVPYPTVIEIDSAAQITSQVTPTDVIELQLIVNSGSARLWRNTGGSFTVGGSYSIQVATNTATTVQIQAVKTSASTSNTTIIPSDPLRRWLECKVMPN